MIITAMPLEENKCEDLYTNPDFGKRCMCRDDVVSTYSVEQNLVHLMINCMEIKINCVKVTDDLADGDMQFPYTKGLKYSVTAGERNLGEVSFNNLYFNNEDGDRVKSFLRDEKLTKYYEFKKVIPNGYRTIEVGDISKLLEVIEKGEKLDSYAIASLTQNLVYIQSCLEYYPDKTVAINDDMSRAEINFLEKDPEYIKRKDNAEFLKFRSARAKLAKFPVGSYASQTSLTTMCLSYVSVTDQEKKKEMLKELYEFRKGGKNNKEKNERAKAFATVLEENPSLCQNENLVALAGKDRLVSKPTNLVKDKVRD